MPDISRVLDALRMRLGRRSVGRVLRKPTVRATAAGTAAVIALSVMLLLDLDKGSPASRSRLLSGAAWLYSSQVGLLTLVDGAAAEVAAQAEGVTRRDAGASVAQDGTTAYVADRSVGAIRRIDGATLRQTESPASRTAARPGLNLYAHLGSLYTVDATRGMLAENNAHTLRVRRTVSLPSSTEVSTVVIDDTQQLWILDDGTGVVHQVDEGQAQQTTAAATPRSGQLLLVAGGPVLADLAAGTVVRLGPDADHSTVPPLLPRAEDETLTLGGSSRSDRLLVASSRRVVKVCQTVAQTCSADIPLTGPGGTDLGPPVVAGNHGFVPNYATGTVSVIDLAEQRLVASSEVLPANTRFELLERDGVVFFNEVGSPRAGVIRPNGTVQPVTKYDPNVPLTPTSTKPVDDNVSTVPPTSTDSRFPPSSSPRPDTDGPATPGPGTGPPDSPLPGVRIEYSKNPAPTGERITLRVVSDGDRTPTSVVWTFGDGQTGSGVTTDHAWRQQGRYQVGAKVTFPDGHTVTAVAPIEVADTLVPLTVAKRGNGSGTITLAGPGFTAECPADRSTCTFPLPVGMTVRLSPNAAPSSAFSDWGTGPCTGTGDCVLTMPGTTVTVTPTFALAPRRHMLTVQVIGASGGSVHSTPPGIDCPSDCLQEFQDGDTVQLRVTTTNAARFTGWASTGPGSPVCTNGTNPVCTFTMPDHDIDVSAAFASTATGDYGIAGNNADSSCFVNPDIDLMSITFLTSARGTLPNQPLEHLITSSAGLSNRGVTHRATTGDAAGTFGLDAAYSTTTTFTIVIDPDNDVPETNERNNGLRITFTLPPKAAINGPQSIPCPAEPFQTDFR